MFSSTNIKYLPRAEWVREIERVRPLMLNEQDDVIAAIADFHNFKPVYIAFYKGKDVVVSFIALTKKNTIRLPIHFFYSSIWVSPELSDTNYCQVLIAFLNELKKDFINISIKLPHQIADIRPFLWHRFRVENRFTYLKDLSLLSYAKDVNQNISKLSRKGFTFKEEKLGPEILNLNMEIFYQIKSLPNYKIKQIRQLISRLGDSIYLTCFSCYLNDELLVSHILFLDPANNIAYTVLRNRVKNVSTGSVHTILYHKMFTCIKEKGYTHIDLLGADMEKIAIFKSRFKADLYAVDILRYSKFNNILNVVYQRFKEGLVRLFVLLKL